MTYKSPRRKLQDKLAKECMDLWQQIVKKRAKYKCEITGQKGVIHAHHIWHRRNFPILRYNPHNGVCLHKDEHYRLHKQGEGELMGVLIKQRGQQWFDDIMETKRNNEGYQYTVEILQGIKIGLETMLKGIK